MNAKQLRWRSSGRRVRRRRKTSRRSWTENDKTASVKPRTATKTRLKRNWMKSTGNIFRTLSAPSVGWRRLRPGDRTSWCWGSGRCCSTSMTSFHCFSLSWTELWRTSISGYLRKSASTFSWSSKTKVSVRTPSTPPCPTTAAPARVPVRPPTAPRPPTRRRPVGSPGTGAWTIASPHWPIPLPRPLPSYQRQRCHSAKIILTCTKKDKHIQQGSIVIIMWDSNDIDYLLILFLFLLQTVLSTELYYFLFLLFLSDDIS